MAKPIEKPWLKNKNHLDKKENKKPELMIFDFGEDGNDAEPEASVGGKKELDETTPRDRRTSEGGGGQESTRSQRQNAAGDEASPRGRVSDRSPRNDQDSPPRKVILRVLFCSYRYCKCMFEVSPIYSTLAIKSDACVKTVQRHFKHLL